MFLPRFTFRRRRSNWSTINRDKAERRIEKGRMQFAAPPEVERIRADDCWDAAYDAQGGFGGGRTPAVGAVSLGGMTPRSPMSSWAVLAGGRSGHRTR